MIHETGTLPSWRAILKDICDTPQKKQKLANDVGYVTVRTIDRWIAGSSKPQNYEVIRKLSQIDEHLRDALIEEFPDAFVKPVALPLFATDRTLPVEFYRRVIHGIAHVPPPARQWTIFHLIGNQMIPHLDPERSGLVMVACFLNHASLHFKEGIGNGFWATRQMHNPDCADTWLIQTVSAACPVFIQSCKMAGVSPQCILHNEQVQSLAYFPFYRSGITVGGVLVCSTQQDFFTPLRQTLIEEYSCLMALAFSDGDFEQPAKRKSL